MKYLVTGGCGFIGRNLCIRLLKDPDNEIVVFDNFSTSSDVDLFSALYASGVSHEAVGRVAVIMGDILDADRLAQGATGADCIVHLAANTGVAPSVADPHMDCRVNVMGTLNALEAARHAGVKRFVFASSGAPVGDNPPPIHEEMAPRPASPYGASKLAGEGYCSAYWRCFGVETVALRFGNVYGPLSTHKASVVAKFIKAAMTGERWEIYGDGGQTRDFIFIDDLVDAVLAAATRDGVAGEIFQIATAKETTVNELALALTQAFISAGLQAPEIVNSERRAGDVMRNFSDTSKARKMLGWQARTPLKAGLDATLRWFLSA